MERSILLLLLIVVAANAARILPTKGICARTCTTSEFAKFRFQPGRDYHYDFESNTLMGLDGGDKQSSGLRMKGRASFEVLSPCEMVLRLNGVGVEELAPESGEFVYSPRSTDFKAAVEQHELHFSFADGTISDLCPVKEEPTWVLNFKRGIVSMIQNTMFSLRDKHIGMETDVTGDCKVRYTLTPKGIRREKDLNACSGRENRQSALQSVPYFVNSNTQTAPLTLSSHVCHQTVNGNGHFEKIICEEEHRLRSISEGQKSARTAVTQSLTYIGDSDAPRRSHAHTHRRTSLKFDFEQKTQESRHALKEMREYLREVCAKSRSDVRPQSPRFFTEIVYRLRRLNERDLKTIFALVDRRKACRNNNDVVRRLVIDAVPILGNAQSMALMKTMIMSGRVSDIEANLWLTSLAFVQKPTHTMLKYLQPLLDEKNLRKQAVLGLSGMVNQYCMNRPECYTEQAVQEIGRSLRRLLNSDCSTSSPEEQKKMLLALKAIGNAGVFSVVSPDLVRCINKEENPMAIRVAATEAFRRMDCSVNRKPLMEVYQKQEIDSELRITSYLAVMACPNEEVLEMVKIQLNKEKVNQVGSFVWTHLTNLAETNDPLRKHLKNIVEDVKLQREFKLDKLKFSRNIEKSIFFKSINAGGRMESNVIWSQKSFLPRSASLNLTTHLFGRSYNFLEINGRVEGLENVLERYFGPDGYFKKDTANKTSELSNKDFQFMDNKFKLQNDNLRGSLGFKVSGHEVAFFDFLSSDKKPKQGFNFLEMLIKLASHQELDWSKNVMFLDSKITIPTISGLPLELSINGTASVNVKAKGKLDIRRMVSWPSTFDIDGSVQPSGSMEVSAMMGINAYYTRHGLKMVSNVHSSTQLDAKLKAKDSETFDVVFGMPRDKQEIINFESKFYVVHRNTEREHSLPNVRRISRKFCTGRGFEKSTGAELCATVRSPAITSFRDLVTIPVVGPFSASVALYKRDTHSSYRLSARWQRRKHRFNDQVYYSRFAHFEIDTPESKTSRKHMMDFVLDFDSRAIRLHLESPQKRLGFSGAFTNKMGRKELKLSFVKDNTAYFHVSMSNRIVRRGLETVMIPSLKLMIPGVPYISLQSRFLRAPGRYQFNIELKNLLRGPMSIGGHSEVKLSSEGQKVISTGAFINSHFFVGSMSQSLRRGRDVLVNLLKAQYGPSVSKQHTAQLSTTLVFDREQGMRRYRLAADHSISQWPSSRSKSILEAKFSRSNLLLQTNIKYGAGLEKLIKSEIKATAKRTSKGGVTMVSSAFVKIPHMNRFHAGKAKIDIVPTATTMSVTYRHKPTETTFKMTQHASLLRPRSNFHFTWDMAASYKKQYQVVCNWDLKRTTKNVFTTIAKGEFNGKRGQLEGRLEIPSPGQYDVKSTIRVGENDVIKVDTSTKIAFRQPHIKWSVDRNGDRYLVEAQYNFRTVEVKEYQLTFSTRSNTPTNKWSKSSGAFKVEDGDFEGKMDLEYGDSNDKTKMTITTNYQLTEEGNKRKREFELQWNHPANSGHVQVGLEKEDYKGSMHLELGLTPTKQFVIDSMYEIDDGWTQKGLMASITVKTPFKKFERTHVGVNLLGQLRYRKAEIHLLWGNNKRIFTTLIIQPTGGTNFLATLKIVTPFARYSYMRFHLKNELTGNQVQSELISEFGTKKTYLKVFGVNNGDYYMNDLAMSVSMNSPFENFRDLTLTIDHKDDSNQYNSKLEFKWNKDKKISTVTNFNYNRNGVEVHTSGVVTYKTPFTGMEQGSIDWTHQNTGSMLQSEMNIEYLPKKKVGMIVNGLITEPETGALRITGKATVTSSEHGKVDTEFLHHHTPTSLKFRAVCDLPKAKSYELQISGSKEQKRVEGNVNINTPHNGYRKIGASVDVRNEDLTKYMKSFIYAGNSKTPLVLIDGKLTSPTSSNPTASLSASLKSRIVKQIEVSILHQHTFVRKGFNSISEITYAPGKALSLTNEVNMGSTKKFKMMLTTPFKQIKSFLIGIDQEGNLKSFKHSHFVTYNDIFELAGNLRFQGVNNMVAESKVSYRGFHYIRLSHKKNGDVYETNGILTFDTSKNIRMKSEIQIDPRLNVEIKLATPFDVIKNVQVKLNAQGSTLRTTSEPLVIYGTASYTFAEKVIVMNALYNMKDKSDIRASVEMKTPFENIRDVSVLLQHTKNGKEFLTSVIGKSEDGRVEVTNIFQSVGTLKNKFVIKSPLQNFKGVTFSFEHRGRFPRVSHKHHLSFDIAGVKAKLNNKFDVYKFRLIEISSAFRSSVKIIKKAGFRFTFDKPIGGIETGLLIEWPTDKVEGRIAFKSSPENKVQLKISTPFYYFKELQGLYTLQNQGIKKFKHHIILAFKNEPLTVAFENSLTLKTLNYIDAQLRIATPVEALKSFVVSYHHEMLKRGKSFAANAEYNEMKYSLKGSYTKMPIHVVDLTLQTPHQNYKSMNLRYEVVYKNKVNWKVTSEFFNAELNRRMTSITDLKKESNLLEARHSVSRNGKILNEVSLKTSWEDEKMYTGTFVIMNKMLPKSAKIGQMIFLEATADLRKAISLRATLRTPFEKAENQWLTLRFERNEFLKADTMKTGNLVLKGNLLSKTAMLQVRYSYGKRPSFQVLLQLPEKQDMKLEGSLVMSRTNSYMKMSLSAPDFLSKPWNLMIDVISAKGATVSFKLDTSFKKYETIAGRASVTRQDKYAKISGRLSMPSIKKPIEFTLEGDMRSGVRLVANLRGPIVRYFRSNLRFSGDAKKFDLNGEMFSSHLSSPFSANLKYSGQDGFKIESSIRTPLKSLERLVGEVSLSLSEKRGFVEIDHNKLKKPIRVEGRVNYSSKNFKGRFFVKTPFNKAEASQLNVDFERDGYKVKSKFEATTTAMKGKIQGNLEFNYEKPKVELKAKIETPFEQLKESSLTLFVLAQRDVNARIMLTHNKLPGEITGRIELKVAKSIDIEISTPFEGWHKHMQLSSSVQKIGKRYKMTTSVRYYPARVITASVQAEVSLPKVYITYNIATPYRVLRQSYGTINMKIVKNFLMESELYHNALREKITLYIRANDAETKTLKLQWNAPFKGPLKDIGVKLFFTRKPGAFDILKSISLPLSFSTGARINYHMNKEILFSTTFDWTSLKKFEAKMKASTPFDIMKKTSARIGFDVLKNILIVAEVNHNKLPEKISARVFTDIASRTFFVRLNTPFDGPHKRITVDGLIKKNGDKHRYEITAQYHPGQKFSLSGDMKPELSDFLTTFKFTSPFENMKEMTGQLTFNPKAKPMLKFDINHNKMPGKIEGRVHVRPFRRLKLILKTPFEGAWKDLLVDYRLKKTGSKEVATATIKYSPNKVLRAQVSYEKLEKSFNTQLQLNTPFDVMKKMQVTLMSDWKKGVLSVAELSHNKLSNSIHLEINYSKKASHLLQVVLTTPFDKMKNIDVKATYMNKGDERKSSLTINYNKSKTVELHGYLKYSKNVKEISLGMKTPFKGIWKGMSFSGQYKKEAQKHNVYMKAIYNTVKTIEIAVATNTDINNFEVSYSLKTPFKVMSFTEGKITLNILSTKYLRAAVADKRIIAELSFVHASLMKGQRLTISTDSMLGNNEKNVKLNIKVMDKTYNGKIYYKKVGNRYYIGSSMVTDKPDRPWFAKADIKANDASDWEITVSTTSPQHRLDSGKPGVFNLNIKHKGNSNQFKNSLELTSPYKLDVKYKGYFSKKDKTAKFNLETPTVAQKVKFTHVGDFKNFKTLASVKVNDMSSPVVFTAKVTTSSTTSEAKLNLNSPFDTWKENSISISQIRSTARTIKTGNYLTKLDFSSSALGTLNIVNDLKMSPNGIDNSFSMDNDIRKTKAPKTLTITFKASPITVEKSSAELTIQSSALKENIEISGEWKKKSESLQTNFKIKAIKDILKSSISIDISKMKTDETKATFSLTSKALKEPVNFSLDWKKGVSEFKANVESKIPVKFMKTKIALRIPKMMIDESEASMTVTSEALKEPATVSISWKKTATSLKANVESQIPVKFMKTKIALEIPKMMIDESEASLTVTSEEMKEPATVSISWKKTATSLKANVESKVPVKFMKTKIELEIPKMMIDESEASLTVTSEEMKEPATVSISWKKTATSLTANVESKVPVKFMKTKIALEIPKMMIDESEASMTVTSEEMKEPATVSISWKKTVTSLKANVQSQLPVKYLKATTTIDIPIMSLDETDASVTISSQDMKEPAKVSMKWKKTPTSFKGSIDSQIPVKYLKSTVSIDVPMMEMDRAMAVFRLTSKDMSEPAKVTVAWKKTPTSFVGSIESKMPVKFLKSKVEIDIPKMSSDNVDATLNIESTELKEPCKVAVTWKVTSSSFDASIDSQVPVKALQFKSNVKMSPMTTEQFQGSFTLEAKELSDKVQMDVSWQKSDKKLSASFQLQTPAEVVKKVRVVAFYEGNMEKMKTGLEMSANKLGDLESTLKWDKKNTNGELSINVKKSSSARRHRRSTNKIFSLSAVADRLKMSTVIESPQCSLVKKIELHTVRTKTSMDASLSWDENKVSVSVNRPEDSRIIYTIETTFEKMRKLEVELTLRIKEANKEFSVKVEHPKGQIFAKVTGKMENGLYVTAKLDNTLIPKVPSMSLLVDHQGTTARKFKNIIDIKIANKEGQMTTNFNIKDTKKEGSLEIKTPFSKFEKQMVKFELDKSEPKFSTEVETGFGSGALEVKSLSYPVDSISVTLKFNKKVYLAELTYSGDAKSFRGSLRVVQGAGRVRRSTASELVGLTLTSELKNAGYSASAELKSSLLPKKFQTTSVQINTKGDFKTFKVFSIEVSSIVQTVKYIIGMKWDAKDKSGSINVNIPTEKAGCFITGDASISLANGIKITSEAANCNNEIYNLKLDSNLMNKLEASLKSPHKPSNFELTYEHSVQSKSVSGEISFKNKRLGDHTGRFIASWTKDIKVNLIIGLPTLDNIELDIKQSGEATKMTIEATVLFPKKKVMTTKLQYSIKNPLSITFDLETPFDAMKKTEFRLSHISGKKIFSTNLEFKHNILGDYVSSLSYDGSQSAKIVFTLNTPHKIIKDLKFTFNYKGSIKSKFDHSIFLTYNGVKVGYSVELILPKLLYRVEIDTPFKNYRRIVITNEHKGNANKFSHNIRMDIGPGNLVQLDFDHHKTNDGYKGNLRFKSPLQILKDIELQIHQRRTSPDQWLMNHQLRYAPGKVIRAQGVVNHGLPSLSAVLTVETPFPRLRIIEVNCQHNHRSHFDFDFRHDLKVNQESGTFRGHLKTGKKNTMGLVMLDTPFRQLKHFDANFRHTGDLRKFNNVASVSYALGKTISAKTRFDITEPNSLYAETHIDSPFEVIRTARLVLKHKGTLKQHFQRLEMAANDRTIVYGGMVSVSNPMDMITEHSLTLPFKTFRSTKVKFDHKNGIAHLNLMWNKANFVNVVGLLNRKNVLLAELTVTTSFQSLKKSSLRLKHAGPLDNFNTQGTLDLNGAKSDVRFRFKRSSPEMSLMTSFPHGVTYSVNVGVQKITDSFQGKLKIQKNNKELLNFLGKLKFDFQAPTKILSIKFEGLLPMVSPNEMNMELAFSGTKQQFVALYKGEFFKKHRFTTNLNYNTYKQVLLQANYNGRPYSFGYIFAPSADLKNGKNLAVELTVNKMKGGLSLDVGNDRIELEIRTPFKKAKDIYVLVHHKQKSQVDFVHRSIFRLNKHRYVNLDLSVDSKNGVIAMKAPAVVTIKYSMNGERVVRTVLEIDPDKNDASKKISINTFFMIDNDASKSKTSHEASFTFKNKYREFSLETKTVIAPKSFFHKTTVNPDRKTSQPWQLFLSTLRHIAGHNRQRTDEWVVSTPVREMKVFMETELRNNKLVNDLDFHWDNRRSPGKKMGWKLKVEQRGKEHVAIVTFHHPKMRDGVSLRTRSIVNSGNSIIRTRANFRYSDNPREAIDFALKISRAGQKMLRGSMSIRQEATQLNTKLSGSFGGNRGVYINGLTLAHSMNGKTKVFQALSHVNVMKRSIMVELVTPMRTYSWMSVAAIHSKGVTVTYQLAFDRSKKAFGEVVFSSSPSFKTRLYFSPGNTDNYVETYGRFVNKKHFEFQIHRMMANRRYSDFVFTLKLRGEHLLKSRLFWRPSLLAEAQRYVQSQIEEVKKNANIMWPQFVDAVRKEWNMKKNLIIATIPNFDSFRAYSDKELELIRDDLLSIGGMIYDSYGSNDFFIADISKALFSFAKSLQDKGKVMTVAIQQTIFEDYLPRVVANLNRRPQWLRMKRLMRRVLGHMNRAAMAAARDMRSVNGMGKRLVYRGVEKLTGHVKSLHKRYSNLERRTVAYMKIAAAAAHHHYQTTVRPRIERVKAGVMRSINTISNYHRNSKESILSHFNRDLRKKMSHVHGAIQRSIDSVSHRYGLLFHAMRQKMNSRLNGTLSFTHARYASDIVKSVIKQVQWAYDQFDVEQKLKDLGHEQYLKLLDYIKTNSIDVIRDYLRLDQNRLITFQPRKGKIEGQVYIPFQMTDLQSRPNFSNFRRTTNRIRKAFRRPATIRMSYLPNFQSMKERILKYIPQIEKNPRAWIPTFRGYASITGKHIVTFDKVHYDLDGNCNYVLSRDYKAERWAVILNQANNKRHISFTVYNRNFGIHPDHSVTVDGKKVELPFVYRNLSILRFGPIIKAKDNVLGFSVTSDVVNDIHTLGVIGWYHGKLGGLFGNFDNEPFNDMQTVDHKITESTDIFIQSWALNNCRHNNKAGPHRNPSKIATKVCKFLFGCPLSPMAKCFSHVNVKPFLKLCLSDVDETQSGSPRTRICRAAKLYVQHCEKAHVTVHVPRICRKCPIPGRESVNEDQSVTIQNHKATADVIFVVEEARCNKDVVPRLGDIVRRMELAFKRRGITDNRYGLVGFGRKVHGLRWPVTHSHTVNSQLMGDSDSFTNALSNFELDADLNSTSGSSDPLRAILKASEYPLRPGASRQIVVVPCSACREQRVDAGEVEDALKDQDIALYVLLDHQIRIRRPSMSPRTNYLFGVDKRAVFTQRDIEKLRGDDRLFRQVVRPRGVCSQLAYSSGGAVFNSRKLTRMHVTSQAWFEQVFANRVASSSHSPQTVDCECNFTSRNHPQLMCKKVGSSIVRGEPQTIPLPLALPSRQGAEAKLEYRR